MSENLMNSPPSASGGFFSDVIKDSDYYGLPHERTSTLKSILSGAVSWEGIETTDGLKLLIRVELAKRSAESKRQWSITRWC